jgi:hypothetical protein
MQLSLTPQTIYRPQRMRGPDDQVIEMKGRFSFKEILTLSFQRHNY